MALPPPLPFISGPSMSQGRDRNVVGGDGEEDLLDAEDGFPDPSPTFKAKMDLVYQTFPEARGQAQDTAPLLPDMQCGEAPATTPSLKQAQPINVLMSQALAHANESTKPSFAKYPAQRYYRSYHTSCDKGRDRPAK